MFILLLLLLLLLQPSADPESRVLAARIAAAERWGRTADRSAATAAARAGLRAKFAREVDPDGILPADEVERRVEHLVTAHMLKMSLAAKKARATRKGRRNAGASA